MRVNVAALALQIASAVDTLSHLQPGDAESLPVIHITDKGKHLDIAITVSRDADQSKGTTHLPSSKG